MQPRDRFVFDPEENILFIDLAGLRIETREQVDETRRAVREILESRGRRAYLPVRRLSLAPILLVPKQKVRQ